MITKSQIQSQFSDLVSNLKTYLKNRIEESDINSKFGLWRVIPVNVFGYVELAYINHGLVFIDASGDHFNLFDECDLHDLIDIINGLDDGYPDVINDDLDNKPENFKIININSARVGHIEYFWKSPNVKGDTFWGWVKKR